MSSFRTLCERAKERQELLTDEIEDTRRMSMSWNYDEVCRVADRCKELAETIDELKEYADGDEYDAGYKQGERDAREEMSRAQ